MCAWAERCAMMALLLAAAGAAFAAGAGFGLGTPATPQQIAGWDIDVRPDGHGLPPGEGTAQQGEPLYARHCSACHGEFGEGRGRFPALMGGRGTLASDNPVKTVGSFWPYATTVFDYLRRAQPFGHAQSLSDDETYALTAFVLNLNELVGYDDVVDAGTLVALAMPNRDGFVADDRPDVPSGEPCMRECRGEVRVIGRAGQVDVTPGAGTAGGDDATPPGMPVAGDAARGERLFVRCVACHSPAPGEHRAGPSLHGVIGRAAAGADGFDRYSSALRGAGIVWGEQTLARFLAAPGDLVPGTTMGTPGLASARDVRDLVAYLRRVSGE